MQGRLVLLPLDGVLVNIYFFCFGICLFGDETIVSLKRDYSTVTGHEEGGAESGYEIPGQ